MDNTQSFKVADKIATQLSKDKLLSGHLRIVRDIIQAEIKQLHQREQTPDRLKTEMTDKELRQELRSLLVEKLQNKTLQASEIAQLKDVFGLADQTSDLLVQAVDYSNMLIDCPHCKRNVHQPIEESTREAEGIEEDKPAKKE